MIQSMWAACVAACVANRLMVDTNTSEIAFYCGTQLDATVKNKN